MTLKIFNIQITTDQDSPIDQFLHYQLDNNIIIPPSQINELSIQLEFQHKANICSPSYLTVPILNADITLNCSISLKSIYRCYPFNSHSPNTTIFYPLDMEYKHNLEKYSEYKRRLYSNDTLPLNSHSSQEITINPPTSFQTLVVWILIGSLVLFIPMSCCCICFFCAKSNGSRHRKYVKYSFSE